MEDFTAEVEWHKFAVALRSRNGDLGLPVCGEWWRAHVAGRRMLG